jgi:hypothetical protein
LVKRHLFFSVHGMFTLSSSLDVFWESNPTNIESPVFRGNTPLTLICQKTLRDPILPMFSLCLSDVGVWDSSFL